MLNSRFSKFATAFVSFASLLALLMLSLTTMAAAQQIGSENTAFVEPPVPHPNTTPCVVTLYSGLTFNDYSPRSFTYTPPAACPGPWAKVILEANFSITQGIQYDRTANIWIGPTNIYFGTTAEPQPGLGRSWHIERDLTDYTSIFTIPQAGTVDLFNIVNSTYTGVLHGSANILFYPVAPNQLPPRSASQVIAFSGGPTGGTVALNNTTLLLEQTLTLPTNITNVYLDVFAQSQSSDEFWYTCVPNDVSSELFSCGGTAFREAEVTIDGTPAGVSPVYPWIYTGGIDPYLWIPIPGVQTMNFRPYRVNLTPFAALLDDGQPHTIALSVFNADSYFSVTGSLLLYQDAQATQFSGAVTENTLAVPVPNITENIHTAQNGNVSGTVNTLSSHNFQISGYINTAAGPVTTTVAQNIGFTNLQQFRITAAEYQQDITQNTIVHSIVTTNNAGGHFVNTVNHNWPLKLNITVTYNSDGSGVQTTSSNQYFEQDSEATRNGVATSFTLLQNRVTATDGLEFNSSGQITGNENQSSGQRFFQSNSTGYCYSRSLQAAANALTAIINGEGCK